MSPEPDRPDDADPTPPTDPPAGPPAGAPQGPPAGKPTAGPPSSTPPLAGPPYPTPPHPGAPGISPEPPGYGQPPGPRRLSFGAGVGIGTGIGCGAYVLGGLLAIALISTGLVGFLAPFVIIAIVGAALMFSARTRPIGTGILIVTAAAWILVLGPCVALLAPGGFT
ncbi:hypothetical protein Q9S71_03580 [Microbacterium sp. KSW4-11]|uniref:DUF4190 domain-containing protein n=1 Tax=Microbacterium gawkjiense TaxID=3067309 RepID=A0ABU3G7V2_9MICO|nr:hypothetical protein [Microbacterium sp. KSW4-11]MDT3315897.1 hypothetical protein [Microbacterium sp. KSW4-11]